MIACDSCLSLFFFFTLRKKLRSGAIVRFSDNSSFSSEFKKITKNGICYILKAFTCTLHREFQNCAFPVK